MANLLLRDGRVTGCGTTYFDRLGIVSHPTSAGVTDPSRGRFIRATTRDVLRVNDALGAPPARGRSALRFGSHTEQPISAGNEATDAHTT